MAFVKLDLNTKSHNLNFVDKARAPQESLIELCNTKNHHEDPKGKISERNEPFKRNLSKTFTFYVLCSELGREWEVNVV